MKPTPTGYCLNPHCGAPVADGLLYCDIVCGKAYRYAAYYKPHQNEANRRWRAKNKGLVTQSHVCHFTDGVCVQCENEKRRATFEKNKKHYKNLTGFRHGSIARK